MLGWAARADRGTCPCSSGVRVKAFYERLVAGWQGKVALTACMRKMLTILNAILRGASHHMEPTNRLTPYTVANLPPSRGKGSNNPAPHLPSRLCKGLLVGRGVSLSRRGDGGAANGGGELGCGVGGVGRAEHRADDGDAGCASLHDRAGILRGDAADAHDRDAGLRAPSDESDARGRLAGVRRRRRRRCRPRGGRRPALPLPARRRRRARSVR